MTSQTRWSVIVPMKNMAQAKTRLGDTPGYRRQMAILMARDTLCAVPCTTLPGVVCSILNRLPLGAICRSYVVPPENVSVPLQSASTA